jgi:prepilin peptidase CpaA
MISTDGAAAARLGYFVMPVLGVVLATVVDLIRREIPDWIPAGLVLWAIIAQSLGFLPFTWHSLIFGCVSGLLVGAIGFRLRSLGGGDVKLLAGLGATIGFSAVWTLLLWTALAGGVLGLIAKCRGERELAYAPAIAVGLLAVLVSEVLA